MLSKPTAARPVTPSFAEFSSAEVSEVRTEGDGTPAPQASPASPASGQLLTSAKVLPDWAAIEADYRSGSMGIREIARFYEIPESTLRKRAKAGAWPRIAKHITAAELRAAGAHSLARRWGKLRE
jgi:hypothetical protein